MIYTCVWHHILMNIAIYCNLFLINTAPGKCAVQLEGEAFTVELCHSKPAGKNSIVWLNPIDIMD